MRKDFVVFYEPFKIQLGFVEIVLDCDDLVFPLCHFLVVEVVGRVHLFEIKLYLVFVGNGDSEALNAYLIVIEAFSEGREVDLAVPLM